MRLADDKFGARRALTITLRAIALTAMALVVLMTGLATGPASADSSVSVELSGEAPEEINGESVLAYAPGDDRMLVRLYSAYFGRAPDESGFDYWRRQLIVGTTAQQISQAFTGSDEFVRRYGTLSDADFVSLVYRNVLGRQAEPEGHAYWVGQLRQGHTRGEIMLGFSESVEYTRLTDHIPTPAAPPVTSYERRGAQALAAISYDWRTELPGWTVEFQPERSGFFGLTYTSSKRIVVYVRASQSDAHLAHVVAHELGHAVDVTLNRTADRDRWQAERGFSATWWPGNGLNDFSTGAGDFAESFAYWQVGQQAGLFHSRLAGLPDQGDRALLAELSDG